MQINNVLMLVLVTLSATCIAMEQDANPNPELRLDLNAKQSFDSKDQKIIEQFYAQFTNPEKLNQARTSLYQRCSNPSSFCKAELFLFEARQRQLLTALGKALKNHEPYPQVKLDFTIEQGIRFLELITIQQGTGQRGTVIAITYSTPTDDNEEE